MEEYFEMEHADPLIELQNLLKKFVTYPCTRQKAA